MYCRIMCNVRLIFFVELWVACPKSLGPMSYSLVIVLRGAFSSLIYQTAFVDLCRLEFYPPYIGSWLTVFSRMLLALSTEQELLEQTACSSVMLDPSGRNIERASSF